MGPKWVILASKYETNLGLFQIRFQNGVPKSDLKSPGFVSLAIYLAQILPNSTKYYNTFADIRAGHIEHKYNPISALWDKLIIFLKIRFQL